MTLAEVWNVEVKDCSAYESLDEEKQALVREMAAEFLYGWTERQFGVFEHTVRPCRNDCGNGDSTFFGNRFGFTPVLTRFGYMTIGCRRCGDECGCSSVPSLRLPGPIQSIDSILIDGEELGPDFYTVQNMRYLVRLDGKSWPLCQDMVKDVTEEGTWQITYSRGLPIPAGGQLAVNALACEFAKAIARDKSCALPQRMQNVTRQGVSVTILDDFTGMQQGQTGIWIIDAWVTSVIKPKQRSCVYSVDIPRDKFRSEGAGVHAGTIWEDGGEL